MTENTLPEAVTFTVDKRPFTRFFSKTKTRTFAITKISPGESSRDAVAEAICSERRTIDLTGDGTCKIDSKVKIIALSVLNTRLHHRFYKTLLYWTEWYLYEKLKNDPEKLNALTDIAIQMANIQGYQHAIRLTTAKEEPFFTIGSSK